MSKMSTAAADRFTVSAHARKHAMAFLNDETIFDGDFAEKDLDLARVPVEAKELVDMWLQSFTDAVDLASKFAKKKDVDEDSLDAVDWLFYSKDDVKGSFGFCCDILSAVVDQKILPVLARLNMIRYNPQLLAAKVRFDGIVN